MPLWIFIQYTPQATSFLSLAYISPQHAEIQRNTPIWSNFRKLLWHSYLKSSKIQGTYFEIQGTYFKICALCFLRQAMYFSACPFATEKFTKNPLFIPACENLRGIPFFSHAWVCVLCSYAAQHIGQTKVPLRCKNRCSIRMFFGEQERTLP